MCIVGLGISLSPVQFFLRGRITLVSEHKLQLLVTLFNIPSSYDCSFTSTQTNRYKTDRMIGGRAWWDYLTVASLEPLPIE